LVRKPLLLVLVVQVESLTVVVYRALHQEPVPITQSVAVAVGVVALSRWVSLVDRAVVLA
jgi:hypothetical protein